MFWGLLDSFWWKLVWWQLWCNCVSRFVQEFEAISWYLLCSCQGSWIATQRGDFSHICCFHSCDLSGLEFLGLQNFFPHVSVHECTWISVIHKRLFIGCSVWWLRMHWQVSRQPLQLAWGNKLPLGTLLCAVILMLVVVSLDDGIDDVPVFWILSIFCCLYSSIGWIFLGQMYCSDNNTQWRQADASRTGPCEKGYFSYLSQWHTWARFVCSVFLKLEQRNPH